MLKPMLAVLAAATVLAATPALAGGHDRYAKVFDDSNAAYLDYKADISEAKRELKNDLASADTESDKIEVTAEFEREIADAETDFIKEMAERGINLPRGTVTVEPEIAAVVAIPRY